MKKLLVVLLVLMLMFTVACAPKAEEAPAAPAEEAAEEVAEEAAEETAEEAPAEKTVLTIAVDDTYPPMEFRDENNDLVGFDIDFAEALTAEMGMEAEFVIMGWDAIFAGLANDKYDCIISSVSTTAERMETIDFSVPYLSNGQVIMVIPGDDSIQSMEDLAGKTVGVQFQTTADIAATKAQESVDFDLQQFDDMDICLATMEKGKIDCIVADYAVAIGAVIASPDAFEISSVQLTNEPIAVALNKGNESLVESINAAIAALQENGKMAEISEAHLGGNYVEDIDTELR